MKKALRLIVACGAMAAVAPLAPAADSVKVRLDFTPVGMHAGMHLAKEKGWFAREGLDVEVQDGAGSLNTIQLVASDQVDIGQVQLGVMALAVEKKLPVKSFAGFMRSTDLAVIVPRDSGIRTLADLKGKKIFCFTASPWVPFIDNFLGKAGLSRKSVDVTMVAPPAMINLYTAREGDGVMTNEFWAIPLVEKTRPSRAIRLVEHGISFPSYGLLASHKTLETRKDMLRKFTKVQVETWEYIWNGHIDEAVQAIFKQRPGMKLDFDVFKSQIELLQPLFYTEATKGRRIGWQATEDWNAAIKSMKDAGTLAGNPKPDDYFTNAYIPN